MLLNKVQVSEINQLVTIIDDCGLNIQDIISVLKTDDPGGTLMSALQGEPVFPRQWGQPEFHPFAYDTQSEWKWPVQTTLNEHGLTYEACADCDTSAWVYFRAMRLHLPKRMKDFIQIASDIQIKVMKHGIQLRQPIAFEMGVSCPGMMAF